MYPREPLSVWFELAQIIKIKSVYEPNELNVMVAVVLVSVCDAIAS